MKIEKINSVEFLTDPNIQDYIVQKCIEIEEKCFKEVLSQYLQREPTIEDAKRSSTLSHINWQDKYIIAYDGVIIYLCDQYGFNFTGRRIRNEGF